MARGRGGIAAWGGRAAARRGAGAGSDAGAVFLAIFGLAVYAQLGLGLARGDVRMTAPPWALGAILVATLTAGLAAFAFEAERRRRGRAARDRRAERRGSADAAAAEGDGAALEASREEPSIAVETANGETTAAGEAVSRPSTSLWTRVVGWFGG